MARRIAGEAAAARRQPTSTSSKRSRSARKRARSDGTRAAIRRGCFGESYSRSTASIVSMASSSCSGHGHFGTVHLRTFSVCVSAACSCLSQTPCAPCTSRTRAHCSRTRRPGSLRSCSGADHDLPADRLRKAGRERYLRKQEFTHTTNNQPRALTERTKRMVTKRSHSILPRASRFHTKHDDQAIPRQHGKKA